MTDGVIEKSKIKGLRKIPCQVCGYPFTGKGYARTCAICKRIAKIVRRDRERG